MARLTLLTIFAAMLSTFRALGSVAGAVGGFGTCTSCVWLAGYFSGALNTVGCIGGGSCGACRTIPKRGHWELEVSALLGNGSRRGLAVESC